MCILVFVYNRYFCALSYMCLILLKIPKLKELSDNLWLIDSGDLLLVIEGGWFEEVCMYMGVSFYFL